MESNAIFYEESGRVNPFRLTAAYFIGLALMLFTGYLYSVLLLLIPIPYLNFLITLGFGIFLGVTTLALAKVSHIRSRRHRFILAGFLGISFNYFQWTCYIMYAFNQTIPGFMEYLANLHWFTSPRLFFSAIVAINEVGLWTILGIPFNGLVLTFIWILEALILISLPVLAVFKAKSSPYSESLSRWYPKYTLLTEFESISASLQLLEDLRSDPVITIRSLGKGNGLRHTKIHLYYLKNDEQHYLTFEKILVADRGRGRNHSTFIVNSFKVDTKTAESILDQFGNRKERFDIL